MRSSELRAASVVVVTGASSGIGRATCLLLASRGVRVVAVARRADALEALVQEAAEMRGEIHAHPADVAEASVARGVVEETISRFGRLDAWVNNAACNLYGPLEVPPDEDIRRLVEVNLLGYLAGSRVALRHFRERGQGVIVNVTSVLGFVPAPYQAVYVATKHALHGLSGAMRQEAARDGISICEVAPGPVDTPLFAQAGNYTGRDIIPPDPITSPERVAAAIVASIERPRRTRVVGVSNKSAVLAGRLFPRLVEVAARRVTNAKHFGSSPTGPTPGNLHDPAPSTSASIGGGWVEPRRRATAAMAVGATSLAIGAGLLMTRASRGSLSGSDRP